jgi:hypothetical protein
MKIGLIDIDGHNYPNLALMKISTHHKSFGHRVEWCNVGEYDIVYQSKVFTFTSDNKSDMGLSTYKTIIKGGTGYDPKIELPSYIDELKCDYTLYPKFESAYGFLTRGCPNKCPWCIVPSKEGNIRRYMDIGRILQGRKSAILMDNNVLASDWGIRQIEEIIRLKIRVDFNQGLDARLIDNPMAKLLSQIKWLHPLRMSCDHPDMIGKVEKATKRLRDNGCKPSKYFIYVLLHRNIEDCLITICTLSRMGLDPFAQPFRDFTPNQIIPQWQLDLARWVNIKSIFKSCEFKDYQPRIGFKCSKYF